MLGLKTIWSKKTGGERPEEAVKATTSITRDVLSGSRAEARPLPQVQPGVALDTRGAERFVPRRRTTILVTEGGKKLPARIINVSINGVAVEADFTATPQSSIAMVGERRVSPGRKISRGTVFLFETPLAAHQCGPELIL